MKSAGRVHRKLVVIYLAKNFPAWNFIAVFTRIRHRATLYVITSHLFKTDFNSYSLWGLTFRGPVPFQFALPHPGTSATFRNILRRVVSRVQRLAGGPPLFGCPLQLIEYIRAYPPYMKIIKLDRIRTGKLRTKTNQIFQLYCGNYTNKIFIRFSDSPTKLYP
jgi:hypothetical protein